jgi:hypothetical protein
MNDTKFKKAVLNWFESLGYSILSCAESRTLAALRDALLPKLMSGELRVPVG